MTAATLPWATGENATLMAALTLEVFMPAQQFKAGGVMVKPLILRQAALGPRAQQQDS